MTKKPKPKLSATKIIRIARQIQKKDAQRHAESTQSTMKSEGGFMADKLRELQRKYEDKQTDKPVIEHPNHAEAYRDKAAKQIRTSRVSHEKAQKED
jgi:hypothetical protein